MIEPSVTLGLAQYDHLRKAQDDANVEIKQLRAEVTRLQGAPVHPSLIKIAQESGVYNSVIKNALPIVGFAIANLDPTYKGWPADALDNLADALLQLPGLDENTRQMAIDWAIFVAELRRYSTHLPINPAPRETATVHQP